MTNFIAKARRFLGSDIYINDSGTGTLGDFLDQGYDQSWYPQHLIAKSPYADIRSFGAVGDGSTDDTAAFQDAVDSGLPIILSPGTYTLTHINVSSDLEIVGPKSAILKASGALKGSSGADTQMFKLADGVSGISWIMKGFTINQNKTNNGFIANSPAIAIGSANRNSYCENVLIDGLTFNEMQWPIWASSNSGYTTKSFRVTNCYTSFSHTGMVSVFGDMENFIVCNNVIEQYADDAIAFQGSTENAATLVQAVVCGNIIDTGHDGEGRGKLPRGILVAGTTSANISGNVVIAPVYLGIVLQPLGGFAGDRSIITNNVVKDFGTGLAGFGIYVYNATNLLVANNLCSDGTGVGIQVSNGSSKFLVKGNVCNNNTSNGMTVVNASEGRVTNNLCLNNGTAEGGTAYQCGIAIGDTVSHVTFMGNTCTDNQASATQLHGVRITGDTGDADIELLWNDLRGNGTGSVTGNVHLVNRYLDYGNKKDLHSGAPNLRYGFSGLTGSELPQYREETVSIATSDATQTSLWLYSLQEEETILVTAKVIASQDDSDERFGYGAYALAYRNTAGSCVLDDHLHGESFRLSTDGWKCYFSATGNNLVLNVVGVAATNVNWVGKVDMFSLRGTA